MLLACCLYHEKTQVVESQACKTPWHSDEITSVPRTIWLRPVVAVAVAVAVVFKTSSWKIHVSPSKTQVPRPPLYVFPRLWSTPDGKEYRGQIDKKYRRNIEAIVRRPNRDEEPEPTSKCPISAAEVPITQLECPATKVRRVVFS